MMVRFFQYCSVALCILIILGCSNNTSQNEKISSPELQTESVTNDSDSPPDSLDGNTNDNTSLDQENHPSISEDTARQLQEIPDIQPYTFTYNEQEFEITPLYPKFLEYIILAREAKTEDWDAIYEERVKDVFSISAWGYVKVALPFYARRDLFTPSYLLDPLEEAVLKLIDQEEHINELIEEALKKSADLLPNQKTKVYVIPVNPELYIEMEEAQGVGGFAYDTRVIVIQLEPDFLESSLQFVVAHEYHHTAYLDYFYKNFPQKNFLQPILIEGKADAFASIIYPGVVEARREPLDNEKHVWEVMKEVMNPESTLSIDFINGDPAMDIPPQSNYKIGYQIMRDFIKNNPDVSIKDWTEMNEADILELSRFEERFED